MTESPLLDVRGLEASYGASQVLFGMDLDLRPGELITLLGRNGMGKTTTVRSIMGILKPRRGSIRFLGESIFAVPPHRVARAGIGLVPEGRQVFTNLTVLENLIATSSKGQKAGPSWHLGAVYDLFPPLKEREASLAGTLSGGEQQMLAIGRALMTNPRLIIFDEATEGLAPRVRAEIWRCLRSLKDSGLSLLVIDKNIGPLLRLADRHFIVEKGHVVWTGTSNDLRSSPGVLESYLGVSSAILGSAGQLDAANSNQTRRWSR
jgi:branched-chain amino acid transport system ATP-binding protein